MEVRPPAAGEQDRAPRAPCSRARNPRVLSLPPHALLPLSILGALLHSAPPAAARAGDGPPTHGEIGVPLPQAGDEVAAVELAVTSVDSLILRATLPVPPRIFPHVDGRSPFRVVDSDGTEVDAQVETVTRYAHDALGADVVELLARVEVPEAAALGERLRYPVIYRPHTPGALAVPPDVSAMLATPGALTLRARDCFGHVYSADLWEDARAGSGTLRTLRDGPLAKQEATHETLVPVAPVGGASGTLPHLFGAHAYVTQWGGERFVSLDLRIHNAHSGHDPADALDDPLGKLYFKDLELLVPPGWRVLASFDNPYLGDDYVEGGRRVFPLVAPMAGGALHVVPQIGQLHRRLVLARESSEEAARVALEERNLGFSVEGGSSYGRYWSWFNPATGRYFPQRFHLPNLEHVGLEGIRSDLRSRLQTRLEQVASGSAGDFPVETAGLGWAHPWGINDGGMVSGTEIFVFDGVETAASGSAAGYRYHQLQHRMYTDRQPSAMFNGDGRPTRVEDWVYESFNGPAMPIWMFNGPLLWAADPFGFGESPSFQRDWVASQGLQPAYEQELLGFEPIDYQHLVRYTRSAKVLAWLGNDALAKDDLRAQAESFRLGYCEYPQDGYGNMVSTGLANARKYVDAYPGTGFSFGRGEGWGIDCMNAAFSFADDEWRALIRPWYGLVLDVVEDGQADCSGIIQSTPLYNVFGAKYRARQSIEAAIVENTLRGVAETVYRDAHARRLAQVEGVLERSFYAMISPLVWSDADHGPWALMATGPFDDTLPPYCSYIPPDGNYGFADHYQVWSSFAYAWRTTGDPIFLAKALEMTGGTDLHVALLSAGLSNVQNVAALLALVQEP